MLTLTLLKSYRLVLLSAASSAIFSEPFILINPTLLKFCWLIVLTSGTHPDRNAVIKSVKLNVARNETCKYFQAKSRYKNAQTPVPPAPRPLACKFQALTQQASGPINCLACLLSFWSIAA